jgi:hypothetical protein
MRHLIASRAGRRASVLALAAVPALASAATGSSTIRIPLEPMPRVSVAAVEGTRAFVAISVKGTRVRSYVCDGTLKRDPTIATWFKGRWDRNGRLRLRRHGHTLELSAVDEHGRIRGALDGEHAFTAEPARDPAAGLFRGRGDGLRATWIILPDRRKRGTFVPTRPPKCRIVAVLDADGTVRYVSTCAGA